MASGHTSLSSNLKCQLSEWGLPPLIVAWFKKKGINSLFQWQVDCLTKNDVLFGGNLVYSAPTSAGKTLVADFLVLKRVLEYGKKALVIEPFVALTREKSETLKSMLYCTKARVGAFGGAYYTPGGLTAVSVAVCTIEKANNFVNKLINESKLGDLGIIVVDEIHYLGDERRGHQLELLLTKVLYYNTQRETGKRIQIVGLSATIPNLGTIARWLNATLYITGYRPVPLVEKIKIGKYIYEVNDLLKDKDCKPLYSIDSTKYAIEKDVDDVFYLCLDTIVNGHSTLVFCESKRECEVLAANLASQILATGRKLKDANQEIAKMSQSLRDNLSGPKIKDVLSKLKKCPAGPDSELVKSLKFGVAFHHAGLTTEEREIIENGFKGGAIKTLMCTSTLSSGVNLPARRVIIRSPLMISSNSSSFQREMLNPITYRQMIGRAGRKNIDTCGESILICKPENQDVAIKLIRSSLGNINSSLGVRMLASEGEPSGLKKAVLEVIANGTAVTRVNLNRYLLSTFWLSTTNKEDEQLFKTATTDTLRFLVTRKFIEELKPGVYKPTRLGVAVIASSIHPDESLELLQDLIKARQGFCLLNDLHIIYQVTPNDISRSVEFKDWQHYSKIWNNLDDTCQFVGQRVGIDEVVVARRAQGFLNSLTEDKERVYKRFWVALIINDLVSEMLLADICKKYRMSKAVVQQSQRAVAQYAGVISIFCEELGYNNIAALVKPLESRINFSCQRDLLDLVRLNITRPVARCLYNAGYKDCITVAKADKLDIEFNIRQLQPFKREQSFSEHSSPSMWIPELAKNMTTLDYASHIVDTARNLVQVELDINIEAVLLKKSEEETSVKRLNEANEDAELPLGASPVKRSRVDKGDVSNTSSIKGPTRNDEEVESMVNSNEVPNFVVHYVGKQANEINEFLDKWIVHSKVSLNFKLEEQINEPIGAKFINHKASRRDEVNNQRQILVKDDVDQSNSASHDGSSQFGLPLTIDIDNKKRYVTKLYACFDDNLTVYIIDTYEGLNLLKSSLVDCLRDSYSSSTAQTATQRQTDFVPIKLYTQNIIMTYKVLYAAFGLTQDMLHKHFQWHSFDVAWWLIQNCPNRGFNNQNSSLSLVIKTKWAKKYHHFLHSSKRRRRRLTFADDNNEATTSNHDDEETDDLVQAPGPLGRPINEFLKLKDIVKSGKTAILQPLLDELLEELELRGQFKSYREAEICSRLTMSQMMINGIGLDMKMMKSELALYEDLRQQMTDIAQKYYAKSNISLTSIKDVARVLYRDLDLKQYLLDKDIKAEISRDPTDAEVLKILAQHHPFPQLVRDFRKVGKALEALQSVGTFARYNRELGMLRVFGQCDFWQLTGRVSMYDPDLFLINRNFTITIPEHGRRVAEQVECMPRRCFVPTKGWKLVAADYAQLELRLLAHFANDQNLLSILNSDISADVFKSIAARVHNKPIEDITNEDRQHAKQICYGILYGMGNRSLASSLGVDYDQAEDFRQTFFETYPQIQLLIDDIIHQCEQVGYVMSLLGRRRKIDGINSENSSIKAQARRQAVNTRIQSSASDLIKLAMQYVDQELLNDFKHTNARLVLEMHDELIYEVNPLVLNKFQETLKHTMECMSRECKLNVKLLVSVKTGSSWATLN